MARVTPERRIANLRTHLQAENPDLVPLVDSYRDMDRLLRRMRLIGRDDTLTARIGWWPVVAAVGLYSAGKSTLINDYLGLHVQRTGNQAVDDKFTVLCHGAELRELPGTALDVDARFPFHGMGDEIERVSPGEGKMVDRYFALKTVPSDAVRGLVLVDSPGFDSDEYRAATLRLIDHVLDLSDLVLVCFDARKPEPGVMRDTLQKLVARVRDRADSAKFLFILNQIDATAREDNLEEVVGAWQRALSSVGIVGGRFYSVFSEAAADNAAVTDRLRDIRARDMGEITRRVREIPAVRGYRVANGLQAVTKDVREEVVPRLTAAIDRWRHIAGRATLAGLLLGLALVLGLAFLLGDPLLLLDTQEPWLWLSLALIAVTALGARLLAGRMARQRIGRTLPERHGGFGLPVRDAFLAATRFPGFLRRRPIGWSPRTARKLQDLRDRVAQEVQRMNDRFASPGGALQTQPAAPPEPVGGPRDVQTKPVDRHGAAAE